VQTTELFVGGQHSMEDVLVTYAVKFMR